MEDEKTVERQMSTLLDEIILKIINEYIETYALRASQYVSARMNRKGNTTYAPAIENQYYLNPTTLIVKGFLDRKSPKLEYVAGLPKVTNLKLVNKTFYDEIIHTLAAKFDGHLSIEHGSNFCDTEDCKAWRPYTGLLSIVSSAWAYSLVTEIYVSDTLNADRTILALRDGFAPNLRKVLIYGGTLIDEGFSHPYLKELVTVLDKRGVEVIVLIDFIAASGGETRHTFSDDAHSGNTRPTVPAGWYDFTLELTAPYVYIIKERKKQIKEQC